MTGVSMTQTPLQFVEVRWLDQQTVGQVLSLEPVNNELSTIPAVIGVQHQAIAIQVRRRQFLGQVLTSWQRAAVLLPLRLNCLSLGHAMDCTTHSLNTPTGMV